MKNTFPQFRLASRYYPGLALMLGLILLLGGLAPLPAEATPSPEAHGCDTGLPECGEWLRQGLPPEADDSRRPSVQPSLRRHAVQGADEFRCPNLFPPGRPAGSGWSVVRPRLDPVTADWGRRPFRL